MIKFVDGNFFDYKAEIRVNTVNCVGVMGAGVALQFKNKYPLMFEEYELQCRLKILRPGNPHVWRSGEMFGEDITIINFPTKDHWKNTSKYEYVEGGLSWLRNYLKSRPNVTITVPALGCGHGGLDWDKVKKMIEDYLNDVKANILVFEPSSSKSSSISLEEIKELEEFNIKKISTREFGLENSKSFKQAFVKGIVPDPRYGFLSILLAGKGTEREKNAVFQFLDAMSGCKIPLLLSYNTSFELAVIKYALNLNFKVLVIVPFGILKLKSKKELEDVWNNRNITFMSFTMPTQDWKSYEGINALKFRIKLSTVLVFATESFEALEKYEKEISHSHADKFYLKFWTEGNSFFNAIHATQIGKDPTYHRPNVQPIINVLSRNRL